MTQSVFGNFHLMRGNVANGVLTLKELKEEEKNLTYCINSDKWTGISNSRKNQTLKIQSGVGSGPFQVTFKKSVRVRIMVNKY